MEVIPYDKRSGKIWFNGENVEWSKAQVHLLSHGLHYASCVFEGIRVYDGEIFKLSEHTERLFYSAKRMGIEYFYDLFANQSKNYFKFFFKNYRDSKYYTKFRKYYYYFFR